MTPRDPADPDPPEIDDPDPRNPDEDGVVVRPLRYVEDAPVVRRIGDRELFLGNYLAAEPSHDRTFEYVLSLSSDDHSLTTHHHPLVDGEGNEWRAFERAVDTARELYRQEGRLLIHCKAGISRSSAVTATTLAAEEGRGFHDALTEVQDARPPAVPNPVLHEQGVVYLAARE